MVPTNSSIYQSSSTSGGFKNGDTDSLSYSDNNDCDKQSEVKTPTTTKSQRLTTSPVLSSSIPAFNHAVIGNEIKDRQKAGNEANKAPRTPPTLETTSIGSLVTNLPSYHLTTHHQNRHSSISSVSSTSSKATIASIQISNQLQSTSSSLTSSSTVVGSSAKDAANSRRYSRTHQRRFHLRFPAVDPHEKLIDWYNCALVADILLQGYLYISENYFAFYSNILGYKTQLLIPICDVISVTKEKTAKIFPNAVGICTDQTKYVFGSLLSRETTFRLMQEVWKSTLIQVVSIPYFSPVIQLDKMINCGEADLLTEKPEEDIEDEIESPSASITSQAATLAAAAVSNQPPLLFANIKPHHSETIKLVASAELTPIRQIFSSSQETDSSGSESNAKQILSKVKTRVKSSTKDQITATIASTLSPTSSSTSTTTTSTVNYQDSSSNWIKSSSTNKHFSSRYGSRMLQKTKDWLFNFVRPNHQLLWNQITGTTRLLFLATTLLVMLFLSALIFLYRVERAHNELLSLQQYTRISDYSQVQLKQLELRKEIKKLVNLLEQKTVELSLLKGRMEDMLNSVQHLPTCI